MDKNVAWIDWLKAISIFLVVWGHMNGLNPYVKGFIYSVHLPAFLVVTGFLSSASLGGVRSDKFLKSQVVYYIKLYSLFSLFSILMWFVIEGRGLPFVEMLRPIRGALLGVHGPNLELVHNNDPLWYFPFLATSLILAYVLMRMGWIFGCIFCLLTLIPYFFNMARPLPWSVDLAPIGALFILAGVLLHQIKSKDVNPAWMQGWLLLLAAFIWSALVLWNGGVNMNGRVWGRSFVFFVVGALLALWCAIRVFENIEAPGLIKSLSRHTLIIFCLHIYFTKVAGKIIFKMPEAYRQLLIFSVALFVTWLCWRIAIYVQPVILNFMKPRKV